MNYTNSSLVHNTNVVYSYCHVIVFVLVCSVNPHVYRQYQVTERCFVHNTDCDDCMRPQELNNNNNNNKFSCCSVVNVLLFEYTALYFSISLTVNKIDLLCSWTVSFNYFDIQDTSKMSDKGNEFFMSQQ